MTCASDPPPLKWSALRYGFRAKEDHDAEEETQARGDCCEAAPGGCAGVAGAERCRSGTLDWGYGGHVLPLARSAPTSSSLLGSTDATATARSPSCCAEQAGSSTTSGSSGFGDARG